MLKVSGGKIYDLKDFTVLIVDDFKFVADLLVAMLEEMGVGRCITASNGYEAQQVLNQCNAEDSDNCVDLIIMDWLMPEMDGDGLIRWIRSQNNDLIRFLPVIVCSAYVTQDLAMTARDLGATNIIVKPISADKLVNRIQRVIDNPEPYIEGPEYFGPNRRGGRKEFKGVDRRKKNPVMLKDAKDKTPDEIVMYPASYRLKRKAGLPEREDVAGRVNPDKVNNAKKIIGKKGHLYTGEVEKLYKKMLEAFTKIQNRDGARRDNIRSIHMAANNIKDITATYNRSLMYELSLSLRDYCEKINPDLPQHLVILKAYIDTIGVTLKQKLINSKSAEAMELKRIIQKAIEMYA